MPTLRFWALFTRAHARTKDEPERDVQMRRILRERDVEAAVKGGAVFAAGGGGWADHGRMLGRAAVNAGEPELVTVDEIADEASSKGEDK